MNQEACAEKHRHPRGDVWVAGGMCALCGTQVRLVECGHCGHATLRVAVEVVDVKGD